MDSAFSGPDISIHAPREGSDPICSGISLTDTDFNPRSPRGERHEDRANHAIPVIISIHAPREGSDGEQIDDEAAGLDISIHAPREGSDEHVAEYAHPYTKISIHAPREGSDARPQKQCL